MKLWLIISVMLYVDTLGHNELIFWNWCENILGQLGQYHGCWCSGSLRYLEPILQRIWTHYPILIKILVAFTWKIIIRPGHKFVKSPKDMTHSYVENNDKISHKLVHVTIAELSSFEIHRLRQHFVNVVLLSPALSKGKKSGTMECSPSVCLFVLLSVRPSQTLRMP